MPRANSAKEDMPSPREYRALKRAAREKVDEKYQLESLYLIRVMGELGLRAGEISHMTEEWVDFDQLEITLPVYDQCCKGKDGGPCGYCKKRARAEAEKDESITYETALRTRWKPKNEESRTIWFGFDESLVELIDEYLYKNGEFARARVTINRRIDRVAEACEMVNKSEIYPHALRAHAATFHANKGMRAFHLKEFMGWSDVDGAMPYIKMASGDVRSELKRIHTDTHIR